MNGAVIGAIISFCVAMTCGLLSSLYEHRMIGEINRKAQDDSRVSYFGFELFKELRIFREYRRLYPNGNLHTYSLVALCLMMLAMVFVVVFVSNIR